MANVTFQKGNMADMGGFASSIVVVEFDWILGIYEYGYHTSENIFYG